MNDVPTFEQLKRKTYQKVMMTPQDPLPPGVEGSDIVLHLPILEYYASLCSHVTEFGFRTGQSTVALIAGCKKYIHSYDIERTQEVNIFRYTQLPCISWQFHRADTGSSETKVEQTEFLLVDTLHTYEHVKKELDLFGCKVSRFIAFHDTFTCGDLDISGPNPKAKGINSAIREFMEANNWYTVYKTDCCNGLWIIKKYYVSEHVFGATFGG